MKTGRVRVRPTGVRSRVRGLIAVQLLVVVLVGGYLTRGPLLPDHGLQQLDALTLHERVPGVEALDGRPTLYVATGPLSDPDCREQARQALSRRGTGDGLPERHGMALLVPAPGDLGALPPATAVRPDPGGTLATRLALPRAASGCEPGYAIVDPAGFVRYRSYDPRYAEHALEQRILLDATGTGQH